jgi:hypothetical protein
MRYYFDIRDGDALSADNIEGVRKEAVRSLADMAREAFQRHLNGDLFAHRMAIEVRTDDGPGASSTVLIRNRWSKAAYPSA